jgi:hypothetical protein
MPTTMKVGQRIRIRVWPNGVVKDVQFQSGKGIRWVDADPPCPWNACADLEATRATQVAEEEYLAIWICPPEYEGCNVGKSYRIQVLPR